MPCDSSPVATGNPTVDGKPVGRSVFYCCALHPDQMSTAQLITDVAMPFVGGVPSALAAGRLTSIQGHVPVDAKQFVIALTCGASRNSDIALHFAVNVFPCSYVARNSRVRGTWGREESAMGQRNRFYRDMDVQVDILALRAAFYVAVNGRHFVKFGHRVDPSQIDTLRVTGDVTLTWVRHAVARCYPETCAANVLPYDAQVASASASASASEGGGGVGDVAVPFVGRLAGTLLPGKELLVEGKVELLPCMFYIRLQKGAQHWPRPDVALSIKARFMKTASGNSELALSSRVDGIWSLKTAGDEYLFKPGTRFKLVVTPVGNTYQIHVNDTLVTLFKHALPPEEIAAMDTITIKGCVFIYKVCLNLL